MNDEWLKFKKYPHIGKPLTSQKDKTWLKSYIANPENIANHKFVPLLHRTLSQSKYIRSFVNKKFWLAKQAHASQDIDSFS